MPDSKTHSFITAQALKLQNGKWGDCTNLINDYSSYPDYYFSDRWKELEKYIFFLDDIQFHYLPDTPYNELYRYWKMNENGGFLSKKFVNENFRHAEAGFTFYLSKTVENLQNNQSEEAKKYLGCLLHTLEDAAFGFHVLEGAGGADGFVLDRMIECKPSPSDILAKIKMDFSRPCPVYVPEILGNSIAEAVMMLYGKYCIINSNSRKIAFQYVMSKLGFAQQSDENFLLQKMHDNAVKICADVIKTAGHLADGKFLQRTENCRLQSLEPYQFPFGGFGSYRFRSFLRDHVILPDRTEIIPEINGTKFRSAITFGSHFKGDLLYKIAPGTFKKFTASTALFNPGNSTGKIEITWLNNSEIIRKITLSAENPIENIEINDPCGKFGLHFDSTPACGIIIIGNPQFEYKN